MANAIKNNVEELISKELKSANEKFPMFHSNHEGYAVILEEVEEAEFELNCIKQFHSVLWLHVMANHNYNAIYMAEKILQHATNLACEAIQIAAMAQKFIDSSEV